MKQTYSRKKYAGLLLLLPWWIGFIGFKLYPFISSLVYSFHDYNLFKTPKFIGLENYISILTDAWRVKCVKTFVTKVNRKHSGAGFQEPAFDKLEDTI